jgi:hypothetical protein
MRYFPQFNIAVAVQVNSDETPEVSRFMATAIDNFTRIVIQETFSRKLSEADKFKLQKLTESWLKLIDTGMFAESWEELSAELKAMYAKETWRTVLQPLIVKVGKIKSRQFSSVDFPTPTVRLSS